MSGGCQGLAVREAVKAVLGALGCAASLLAGAQTIDGTATYRERIALPPNAVFEAALQDTARADAPAVVLGRHLIEPVRRMPLKFSIPYDPQQLRPQGRYAVSGKITVDGQLWFTTDTYNAVLRSAQDTRVDLLLHRVESHPLAAAPGAVPLLQTDWKLVQVRNDPVPAAAVREQEAHLVFQADPPRVSGSGGCNRFAGAYALDGDKLALRGVVSTKRACLGGGQVESRFLSALSEVTHYRIQGARLVLFSGAGAPVLHFEAVAPR